VSIDIIVEVMDHAPAELTPAERYALLVLAEDARLPSREIKHDITDEYLLERLRMSARSWVNMRSELVKKKAIEKVQGGHNGKRARYRIPVFNEAMKGHPIGDSTVEDASELGTGIGDSTSVKGHRLGESRVTQSVTLTYIPPITPGGNTPTTRAAALAPPAPGGGGGGSIDQDENPHNDKARRVLASLPASHQPGRGGGGKLTAAVAELLALGWPEDALRIKLAADLPPSVSHLTGLLIKRLPDPVEYQRALAPTAAANGLPHWCGYCGNGGDAARTNVKFRRKNGDWCPDCHPDMVKDARQRPSATARAFAQADAAGEEVKRIIAASRAPGPYRNPADQSVYYGEIA
jgi:hypothetical protein